MKLGDRTNRVDMNDRIARAGDMEEDLRAKAMQVCALQGQNADEILCFLQMLGLVDEYGRKKDAVRAPHNLQDYNGNIVPGKS